MDRPARPRIVGIDVARALAVLGMFAAHMSNRADLRLPNDASALEVFDGRPSAGFALLAGVSAALMSGGSRPVTGARMRHARVRILGRAALLWPLGAAMIALRTPVAVILPTYAVLFAVTAAFLGLRPRTLAVVGATIAVGGPVVIAAIWDHVDLDSVAGPHQLVSICFMPPYPALVWLAYLLVGLAIGRLDLNSTRVRRRMLGLGVAAATVGLVTGSVAMRALDPTQTFWRDLLTSEPHSSSPVEVLANVGVVVAVIAICLTVADRFPRTVAPLAATGAFALTAYCGHLVYLATDPLLWMRPDSGRMLRFVVVTVAVAWLWRRFLGRGPLEIMLTTESTALADAIVPAGRRAATPAQPPAAHPGAAPGPDPSPDDNTEAPATSALGRPA